jgi:hypothetical protein
MADQTNQFPQRVTDASRPLRARLRSRFPLCPLDILSYRLCDAVSGFLIFLMLIFSPWAFGTTETWSIRIMNVVGCTLGGLLLIKWFIRSVKGFPALRWDEASSRIHATQASRQATSCLPAQFLAGFTFLLLAYCLVAAVNAAATYHPASKWFEYHSHIEWLPHSFDSQRTWFHFWMYVGLAGAFWAVHDWLCGMTEAEAAAFRHQTESAPNGALPGRLRALLWLLCVNGALLGVEGIFQRVSGSNALLFLVHPRVNPEGITQFGPYAYRSNAAQFFNLLWPVCLGFWLRLQGSGGLRLGAHHGLLLCAAVMAACPFISSSRGSALTSATMLSLALVYLIATSIPGYRRSRAGESGSGKTVSLLTFFFILVLGLGWYFGWDTLSPRLEQLGEGYENREAMYAAARPMTKDYPWLGTGPGTFATVFQLYRFSNATYWPEQLHNDWLETRITFGWIGMALALGALACICWRRLVPGQIHAGRRFVFLGWLALAGCLVQGVFDFPLQIHSILLLFLVICAILLAASGRRPPR